MKLNQGKVYKIIMDKLCVFYSKEAGHYKERKYLPLGELFIFLGFENETLLKLLINGNILYFPYFPFMGAEKFSVWFEEINDNNNQNV